MFEVTQQEYEKVMGNDPSRFSVLVPAKVKRRVDLIVSRSDSVNPLSTTLKESIAAEIAALDGVESVTPGLVDFWRSRNWEATLSASKAGRRATGCSAN